MLLVSQVFYGKNKYYTVAFVERFHKWQCALTAVFSVFEA